MVVLFGQHISAFRASWADVICLHGLSIMRPQSTFIHIQHSTARTQKGNLMSLAKLLQKNIQIVC